MGGTIDKTLFVSYDKKIYFLVIAFVFITISSCSYVDIDNAYIKVSGYQDALDKISRISNFLLENGFVAEYDPECTYDLVELCNPKIHSSFFKLKENNKYYRFKVGLSMKDNVIYIRGVPPAHHYQAKPYDFESILLKFLNSNFDVGEYQYNKVTKPDLFR